MILPQFSLCVHFICLIFHLISLCEYFSIDEPITDDNSAASATFFFFQALSPCLPLPHTHRLTNLRSGYISASEHLCAFLCECVCSAGGWGIKLLGVNPKYFNIFRLENYLLYVNIHLQRNTWVMCPLVKLCTVTPVYKQNQVVSSKLPMTVCLFVIKI